MFHEEGNRSMAVVCGYELVVVEHQYNLTGQLGEPIYYQGKRDLDEPPPSDAHSRKNVGSEVLCRCGQVQRFCYVPPHPDRVVVLLVEGDPGEGEVGFFYLTPVSQERRFPVASWSAN